MRKEIFREAGKGLLRALVLSDTLYGGGLYKRPRSLFLENLPRIDFSNSTRKDTFQNFPERDASIFPEKTKFLFCEKELINFHRRKTLIVPCDPKLQLTKVTLSSRCQSLRHLSKICAMH